MYRTDSELITIVGEKRCEKDGEAEPYLSEAEKEVARKMYKEAFDKISEAALSRGYRPHSPAAAPPRCPWCGASPFVEQQLHGHYYCVNCNQVTQGCCNGELG